MSKQSYLSDDNDDNREGIKKVCFKPLTPGKGMPGLKLSMSYLEDIEVTIVVELGRATLKTREILALEVGSIIEVEKSAGDSVDVYVNNQRFGKGEVVVINDMFALKIIDIIPPNSNQEYGTGG